MTLRTKNHLSLFNQISQLYLGKSWQNEKLKNRFTWGSVGGNQSNALSSGGALSTGLDYEVLVGACEAREPIENLLSHMMMR